MKNILNKLKVLNEKYYVGLIIFIFTFLFAPPIIPNINFIFINFIYALFVILFKYKIRIKNLFKDINFKKVLKLIFIYFLYYIFIVVLNSIFTNVWNISNYIINIYSMILAFPIVIVCCLYIIFRSNELNINYHKLIKLFIIAGLIQSFIAILTLLVPPLKSVLVSIMYWATGDKLLATPWVVSRRFFGFANNMLDLFGFGTGIIAILPLYYYKDSKSKIKGIILFFLLLLVPILNSRSGIVIAAIGVVIYIISIIIDKDKNEIKQILKYVLFSVLILVIVFFIVYILSPNTLSWIIDDFASFIPNVNSNSDSTANVLFSKAFWTLPNNILNIIFGCGINVSGYSNYSVQNITHSDVGYINEVWKVGIIGTLLVFYLLFFIIKTGYKKLNDKKYKYLLVFFGISILVISIKCSVITYNTALATIMCLSLMPFIENGGENNAK